tara:strand:- start:172 stop:717 length:546 start_codon:yes stop_codon:yes gene_type:complete
MEEQNMYQEKTNWILYTIIVVISFVILLLLNGGLSLSTSFGLFTLTIVYFLVSALSLVIGLITGLILNKVAKSNKALIVGGSIISFLTATIISIFLSVQNKLSEQMQAFEEGGIGLSGLFEGHPNPILIGILTIIFFNLTFVIIFMRKEQKSMKDLLVYLVAFVIYFALYFLIPIILMSTI